MPGNSLGVIDTGTTRTVLSAAAITRGLRVKFGAISTGGVPSASIADASHPGHGTAEMPIPSGEYGTVRQYNNGSVECVAAKAITAGATIYTIAGGKVTDAATSGIRIGEALTDAAADGDLLQVAPLIVDKAE